MKMGKLLLGKIFVLAVIIAVPLVLAACGPTLMAFEPPAAELSSIVLRTDNAKIKTAYMSGEFFVPTGLTVEAVYTDRTKKEIALDNVVYDKVPLTLNNTVVTFSYTEGTITRSANLSVDVTVIAGGAFFDDKAWWAVQDDGPVYRDNILWGYKGAMPENYTLNVTPGTQIIAENAFYYFINLTAVTIPDSVFYIGSGAFRDTGVTKFEIPNSVKTLGNCALAAAVNNTITVGTGVTNDLEKTFDRTKTTKLSVPGNDTYAAEGGILFSKDRTKLITVLTATARGTIDLTQNTKLTEIASGAFSNCTEVTYFYLPATLQKIGSNAFANCTGLTNVVIPATVTEIGDDAFGGCANLTNAQLDADTSTVMGKRIFSRCTALAKVEVYNKVIPSITADVFPQNAFLKIEIHTPGNVASRLAAVRAMPGWDVHYAKITEVR